MSEKILEKAYDLGFKLEKEDHGCSQCAIKALHELFPELRDDNVFKSASALAGGVGLSAEGQCGALSGSVMVVSQLWGREISNLKDPENQRYVAYRMAAKIIKKFKEEYGTIICGGIQTKLMGRSFDLFSDDDRKVFEEKGGHSKECPSVVGNAVKWAAELILEEKGK